MAPQAVGMGQCDAATPALMVPRLSATTVSSSGSDRTSSSSVSSYNPPHSTMTLSSALVPSTHAFYDPQLGVQTQTCAFSALHPSNVTNSSTSQIHRVMCQPVCDAHNMALCCNAANRRLKSESAPSLHMNTHQIAALSTAQYPLMSSQQTRPRLRQVMKQKDICQSECVPREVFEDAEASVVSVDPVLTLSTSYRGVPLSTPFQPTNTHALALMAQHQMAVATEMTHVAPPGDDQAQYSAHGTAPDTQRYGATAATMMGLSAVPMTSNPFCLHPLPPTLMAPAMFQVLHFSTYNIRYIRVAVVPISQTKIFSKF